MNSYILELFDEFKAQKIKYCHFKSNNNLVPALCGVDDLDLLVSYDNIDQFNEVLASFRFRLATDRVPPAPCMFIIILG